MTKADIVNSIAKDTGIIRRDVAIVVDAMLNTIKDTIKSGQNIEIRQFGTFKLKVHKARVGRNLKTNVRVPVPQRVVPTFKFSKEFKLDISNSINVDIIED
jgi:nucleoid DNA-binding protein